MIEIPLQTSLPYILLPMVYANYCAPYPKQPYIVHEVNMWYPCCIILFILESSTPFSQVLWLMLWPIISNPNLSCSKNRKMKIKRKEKKKYNLKPKNKVHFQQSWQWGTYCYLSAMHPVQTKKQLWKKKLLKNNNNKYNYELLTLRGTPGRIAQCTHTSYRD